MSVATSSANTRNYVVTLNLVDFYDIDELDCMFQQVLAIHLGFADQIQPFITDDPTMSYVWENKEDV